MGKKPALIIEDGEVVGGSQASDEAKQRGSNDNSSSGGGGSSNRSVEDFDPDNYPLARTVEELGEIRRNKYGYTDQEKQRISEGKDPVSRNGTNYVVYDPGFDEGKQNGEILGSGDTKAEAALNQVQRETRNNRDGRIQTENLAFDQNLSDITREQSKQFRSQADQLKKIKKQIPNAEKLRLGDGPLAKQFDQKTVSRDQVLNQLEKQRDQLLEKAEKAEKQSQLQEIQQERQKEQQKTLNKQKEQKDKASQVLGKRPVNSSDPFIIQADAELNNIAKDNINEFISDFQTDKQIIGDTRPAQFGGDVLATLEQSIFNPDPNPSRNQLQQRQQQLDRRSDDLGTDIFGSVGASAANFDDLAAGVGASLGKEFTEANIAQVEDINPEIDGSRTPDQDLTAGVLGFGLGTAKQARKDPFKFASGAALETLLSGGSTRAATAGAKAARKAPDTAIEAGRIIDPATGVGRKPRPGEPTKTTPDILSGQLNNAKTELENFIRGDLETQRRTTEGKEFVQTNDPDAPGVRRRGQKTKENIFNIKEGEEGITIDPQTQDAIVTEQLSRREYLSDLIDLDTSKGQARLTQPRQKQKTDTESLTQGTSTDVTSPQDRLQNVQDDIIKTIDSGKEIGDNFRRTTDTIFNEANSQANTPITVTGPVPAIEQNPVNEAPTLEETVLGESISFEQPQIFEQPQKQEQPQTFEQPQRFEQPQKQEQPQKKKTPGTRPETPSIFRSQRPERQRQPQKREDPERPRFRFPDFDDDTETEEEEPVFDTDPDRDPFAFPDIFSVIGGETQASDQETFTGFESRTNKEIDKEIDRLL